MDADRLDGFGRSGPRLLDRPISVLRPLWFPCFTLPWAMSRCQHTPYRVCYAQDPDGDARHSRTGRSGPVLHGPRGRTSFPRKPESAWRTHLRSVCAVHPSFDATEGIADHCESCSPWCSNTRRTARSRTCAQYLAGEFICPVLPKTQRVESPGFPGRFTSPRTTSLFSAAGRFGRTKSG